MLRLDFDSPVYPVEPGISLDAFERLIMIEPDEVAGVFGPDERLLLAPKRGQTDRVAFVEHEARFLASAIVTHNHPSGGVFSYDDASLAAEQDLAELRAVTSDGLVYSLFRPGEGWPTTDVMVQAVESSIAATLQENGQRRRSGASILKGRTRDAFMFAAQRSAFAEIGVDMRRTNVWRR